VKFNYDRLRIDKALKEMRKSDNNNKNNNNNVRSTWGPSADQKLPRGSMGDIETPGFRQMLTPRVYLAVVHLC